MKCEYEIGNDMKAESTEFVGSCGKYAGLQCPLKKRIKIKFLGFAPYHKPHEQAYYRFLSERYDVVECDDPDYIIDGGLDFRHVKYDCVKILLNGENTVPNFDLYDYAVASSDLSFGDRYLRMPWFAFYPCFACITQRKTEPEESLLNRGFCSFVVSNAEFGDPMRRKFFEALSKYKPVASGGRYRNNVGGPISDKVAFCRGYKFNIAFENSSYPGYTTEKIMEAYVAQTVPVYYGNPTVETDFRVDSMVRVTSEADIERAIEEIVRLDRDDEAYLKVVTAQCLVEDSPFVYEQRLESFLAHIFDQPIGTAGRLCSYGCQAMMRRHLKPIRLMDQRLRDSAVFRWVAGISGKIRSR